MASVESLCHSLAFGPSINCLCCFIWRRRKHYMWEQILPGLRINIFATILFGVIYPLAITGVCQVLFPHRANGSLITAGGKVIGSEIIGQNFTKPEYFWPRPSAAGDKGYDATASGGSNYGPTNKK